MEITTPFPSPIFDADWVWQLPAIWARVWRRLIIGNLDAPTNMPFSPRQQEWFRTFGFLPVFLPTINPSLKFHADFLRPSRSRMRPLEIDLVSYPVNARWVAVEVIPRPSARDEEYADGFDIFGERLGFQSRCGVSFFDVEAFLPRIEEDMGGAVWAHVPTMEEFVLIANAFAHLRTVCKETLPVFAESLVSEWCRNEVGGEETRLVFGNRDLGGIHYVDSRPAGYKGKDVGFRILIKPIQK